MLLSFQDVTFSYTQDEPVLKNISFNIEEKERVALLGLNGAGKSTLMLHTNGLLLPSSGKVKIEGWSTDSKKQISEIRKIVGIVFQNPDDQLFMATVKDDVAFGPRNMGLSKVEVDKRVNEALTLTGTLELAHRSPSELSGGQKKSVSIATVLSMSPKLLVMDEPTSGLDRKAVSNFIEIISHLPQSILLSTHDLSLARNLCQRALVISDGQIIFDGTVDDAIDIFTHKIEG